MNNVLSGMLEKITARLGRAISGDLQSQISRLVGGWNSGGSSSRGSSGSSPGRAAGASPGLSSTLPNLAVRWAMSGPDPVSTVKRMFAGMRYKRARTRYQRTRKRWFAIQQAQKQASQQQNNQPGGQPSPPKPTSWMGSIKNWFETKQQNWLQQRTQRQLLRDQANFNNASNAVRTADQTAHLSPVERLLYRINGSRPNQYKLDPKGLNASTPEGIVLQMMGQQREQKNARTANSAWLDARKNPFAQAGRAKQLATRAAAKYQALAKKRDSLKTAAESARKRFLDAPGAGKPGYNAARSASLLRQSKIAADAYKAADSKAADALARLSQTSALYSQSTNVAAGAMRFLGGALTKGLGSAAAIITTFTGTPRIVESIAESFAERQRWTRNHSARAGVAFNNYDLSAQSINHAFAEQTAGATKRYLDELGKFKANIMPFNAAVTNVGLGLGSFALGRWNAAAGLAQAGADAGMALWMGNWNDKKFWDQEKQIREIERRKVMEKRDDTFKGVFGGWTGVDVKAKDARNNSKTKDVLPPLK